jgi:secreted trypsin-like serine protease
MCDEDLSQVKTQNYIYFVKLFFRECNLTHMNRPLSLKETIEEKLPELFQNHVLCAGTDIGGQGSCKGDSGGPLMFRNRETNTWIQFALVQGAVRDCGDIDYPGIYLRLDDKEIFSFISSNSDIPKKMSLTLSTTDAQKGKVLFG